MMRGPEVMGKPHFRIVAAFEDLDCATLLS